MIQLKMNHGGGGAEWNQADERGEGELKLQPWQIKQGTGVRGMGEARANAGGERDKK